MAATTGIRGSLRRLYRGETNIDFIGQRKKWYTISATILVICLASIIFRSFNFGVEFVGGNQFQLPAQPGTSLTQVRDAAAGTGVDISSAQIAGSGANRTYVIRTPVTTQAQRTSLEQAMATADHINVDQINTSEVSSSWGKDVTNQAVLALVVFLLAVSVFIWARFQEIRMAGAAVLALFHDLILTAGVYSLIGFEVTPGTVIGLLTILGYSLYDTVVVFDKVNENTAGVLGSTRYTYADQANRAVNQTLMRSINTSLIGLLPVAGLLFVGAGILGVGTLKDLALVLFVGMITGAYSSLFLATPWAVDFKMMDQRYKAHAVRVRARRGAAAAQAAKALAEGATVAPGAVADEEPAKAAGAKGGARTAAKAPAAPSARRREAAEPGSGDEESTGPVPSAAALAGSAPRVGARPSTAKRPQARSGRSSGGKRRR